MGIPPPQHSQIRLSGGFFGGFSQFREHFPPRRPPQDAMIRKMNPTEEVDTRSEGFNDHFARVEFEFESGLEKARNDRDKCDKIIPIR